MYKSIYHKLKAAFFRVKLLGDINNKPFVSPVYINDKEFGESTKYHTILEINVDQTHRPGLMDKYLLDKVGKLVRNKYFDFDFVFNVSFSCSKPKLFAKDNYADPYSIWFNVFVGFYQIDVFLKERDYPFGFDKNLKLNPEEILKIGKSDWNYFSNFLYGVPSEDITENVTKIEQSEIDNCLIEKETINGIEFYKLTVEKFKVISPYQAKNDKKLNNKWNNWVWKVFFGFPFARKKFTKSFIPTNMKAVMYIYYKDIIDDNNIKKGHSSLIFGGTINLDYPKNALKDPKNKKSKKELESQNERFLELQLKEIKKVIPKILNNGL